MRFIGSGRSLKSSLWLLSRPRATLSVSSIFLSCIFFFFYSDWLNRFPRTRRSLGDSLRLSAPGNIRRKSMATERDAFERRGGTHSRESPEFCSFSVLSFVNGSFLEDSLSFSHSRCEMAQESWGTSLRLVPHRTGEESSWPTSRSSSRVIVKSTASPYRNVASPSLLLVIEDGR